MSDESGKAASGEVDLDNLEVELLIICKNQNLLNSSASFLTRRGWPTTVLTDVNRAIEHLADKRPDFVLVSLSHPNAAILKLPDLISQTFNIYSVGFVETSDSASAARLNQSRIRYKIPGQPSGPAIYRALRKVLAERFSVQPEASGSEDRQAGSAAEGGMIVQKGSTGPAAKQGSIFFRGGEGTDGAPDNAESETIQGEAQHDKGPRRSLKQLQGERNTSVGGDMLFGKTLEKKTSSFATEERDPQELLAEIKKNLLAAGGGNELTAMIPEVSQQLTGEHPEGTEGQAAGGSNELASRTSDLSSQGSLGLAAGEDGGNAHNSRAGMLAENSKPNPEREGLGLRDVAREVQPADRNPQSIMEKAVEAAMGRVCQSLPEANLLRLEEITHVGVCPIDGSSHAGYLVIVWQAPDQGAREEFLRGCEREIQSAFDTMNVACKLEPSFWVDLPAVDFMAWAQSMAEFTFALAHQKREVGVAFFSTGDSLEKPSPTDPETGMFSFKVEKMSTEVPVTFKAFIHFVNSRRFILYLRAGRVLQPEQKERLIQRQLTDFYINSVDMDNVRRYIATSHLGGMIKKGKKAA